MLNKNKTVYIAHMGAVNSLWNLKLSTITQKIADTFEHTLLDIDVCCMPIHCVQAQQQQHHQWNEQQTNTKENQIALSFKIKLFYGY